MEEEDAGHSKRRESRARGAGRCEKIIEDSKIFEEHF